MMRCKIETDGEWHQALQQRQIVQLRRWWRADEHVHPVIDIADQHRPSLDFHWSLCSSRQLSRTGMWNQMDTLYNTRCFMPFSSIMVTGVYNFYIQRESKKVSHQVINLPKSFISILDWNDKVFVSVKRNGSFPARRKLVAGVLQGGVLSPTLCNVYVR